MNRRGFLKALGAGAALAVAPPILVPEKTFWFLDRTMVPGSSHLVSASEYLSVYDLHDRMLNFPHRFEFVSGPPPGSMIWWAEQAAMDPPTRMEKLTIEALDEVMRGVWRGQA